MNEFKKFMESDTLAELTVDITVIGLGYVGLPTAAVMASCGWNVCGVDISDRVVSSVNSGEVHFEEKNLNALVENAIGSGKLKASLDVPTARFYVIAVPTPLTSCAMPDLSCVEAAARTIAPKLLPGACVIVESTSPVGTTERLANIIGDIRPDLAMPNFAENRAGDIAIAYCPERVLPGKILSELITNDRVIGGVTDRCAEEASQLYTTFVEGSCKQTDCRTAETVKLVENSYRDVNIAFANELSMIADEIGVNIWDVIALANRHPRVNILRPGPGVGGHCIAVDPWFLAASAPATAKLIRTAREVNVQKTAYTTGRIRGAIEVSPQIQIALLGLTFKPDVDDLRESPALAIACDLARDFGERLCVVEPHLDDLPPVLQTSGLRLTSLDDALETADMIVVLVDHSSFKHLRALDLSDKTIIDTRGLLGP